jgi:hypothetical protein
MEPWISWSGCAATEEKNRFGHKEAQKQLCWEATFNGRLSNPIYTVVFLRLFAAKSGLI